MIIGQYADGALIGNFHAARRLIAPTALGRYHRHHALRPRAKQRRAFSAIRRAETIAARKFQVHYVVAARNGKRRARKGVGIAQALAGLLVISVFVGYRIFGLYNIALQVSAHRHLDIGNRLHNSRNINPGIAGRRRL